MTKTESRIFEWVAEILSDAFAVLRRNPDIDPETGDFFVLEDKSGSLISVWADAADMLLGKRNIFKTVVSQVKLAQKIEHT